MAATVSPDDLWSGRARFVQVGDVHWPEEREGTVLDNSSWFFVANGIWYAFSRQYLTPIPQCPADHTRVVIRSSRDKGKSWSGPVPIIEPGSNGDGCAVLDGSTYYDEANETWHILAQCLATRNEGGWSLCHYSRRAPSPAGPFVADNHNPVVRNGELWSRICEGRGKACDPANTVDEGTPDIVQKAGGRYLITLHGYNYKLKRSYRGVVATPDFLRWAVDGPGLPGDAILGPADCGQWVPDCTGVGAATSLIGERHTFLVIEAMNRGLVCTTNQDWIFQIVRAPNGQWPRSGSRGWSAPNSQPLITRSHPDPNTPCALTYARWIADGSDIYLIYEDWEPGRTVLHRRLLKLVAS
ncbi:hypothetical protein [Novosphingobium sp. PhB165]|uniref:hypothetical protein n=1 Tax=Novosphingobium sp. PhB165 TaxID=2485105 RepID=UPI0014050845|nr:hypothetical protein [Novosphingobium sp. PhB165]